MYMEWVIYGNSTAYGDSFAAGIGGVSAVENTYVKTGYLRVYKESGYGLNIMLNGEKLESRPL